MKRSHRTLHAVTWLLLPPLLLLAVALADRHRIQAPPPEPDTAHASDAGVLP